MFEVDPAPDAVLATPSHRELETRAARVFDSEWMQAALAHVYTLAKNQPQAQLPAGAGNVARSDAGDRIRVRHP